MMLTTLDVAAIVGMLLAGTLGIEWGHNVTIDPPGVAGGIVAPAPVDCADVAQSQRMAVRLSAFEGGVLSREAYAATMRQGPLECRDVRVDD